MPAHAETRLFLRSHEDVANDVKSGERHSALPNTIMPIDAAAKLTVGLRGAAEITVMEHQTAPHIGSGHIRVLATPVLVILMEAAALKAVDGLLPEGYQTVGIHLDVRHFAATPVSMRVTASAEVIRVDGRSITFHVLAEDEKEPIGEGTHERVIVNVARFDQRIQQKLGGSAEPKDPSDETI